MRLQKILRDLILNSKCYVRNIYSNFRKRLVPFLKFEKADRLVEAYIVSNFRYYFLQPD